MKRVNQIEKRGIFEGNDQVRSLKTLEQEVEITLANEVEWREDKKREREIEGKSEGTLLQQFIEQLWKDLLDEWRTSGKSAPNMVRKGDETRHGTIDRMGDTKQVSEISGNAERD